MKISFINYIIFVIVAFAFVVGCRVDIPLYHLLMTYEWKIRDEMLPSSFSLFTLIPHGGVDHK